MEQRTERFEMKLTPTERESWDAAARKHGLSLSDYVRLIINQSLNGVNIELKPKS